MTFRSPLQELDLFADIFYALGDPTCCAIVGALGNGRASVSTLAQPFAMVLPSFMKHLSVLERRGVIRSAKAGQVRACQLQATTLSVDSRAARDGGGMHRPEAPLVEKLHQEDLRDARRQPQRSRRR